MHGHRWGGRGMRLRVVVAMVLKASAVSAASLAALPTGHQLLPEPRIDGPALHATITDPVFGTRIERVSDPSQVPGIRRIRHYYSKSQPFNADGSRAILFAGDGTYVL